MIMDYRIGSFSTGSGISWPGSREGCGHASPAVALRTIRCPKARRSPFLCKRRRRTTYVYDDNLRLIRAYPSGSATAQVTTYDAADRVLSVTEPDGSWTSATYDAVGNKVTEARAKNGGGVTTDTITYDINMWF